MLSMMCPNYRTCADSRALARIDAIIAEDWSAETDAEVRIASERSRTPLPFGVLIVSLPSLEAQKRAMREGV